MLLRLPLLLRAALAAAAAAWPGCKPTGDPAGKVVRTAGPGENGGARDGNTLSPAWPTAPDNIPKWRPVVLDWWPARHGAPAL